MRKIREVLRLWSAGKSQCQIAVSAGIGQSKVGDYLSRARRAGISATSELDDAARERALYPHKPALPAASRHRMFNVKLGGRGVNAAYT